MSWLENAYSCPLFRRPILTHKVGETDPVFGVLSAFVSRSAHARLYTSLCVQRLGSVPPWLTLSPPIPLRLYTLPYWSNPAFLIFDIRALWRSGLSARAPERPERQSDQYGAGPFEQQQFETAGVERVNIDRDIQKCVARTMARTDRPTAFRMKSPAGSNGFCGANR